MTLTLDFPTALQLFSPIIQEQLEGILHAHSLEGEINRPSVLLKAMRHGVLNGGKRLRPWLVCESAALFGADPQSTLRVGAALECIHCYSLIHDDLPAMDDDDMRRGQPTVHVAFDEPTAILAGDGLLTLGFDIIAAQQTILDADIKISLISALSRASGVGGMVGGQILDLAADKNPPDERGIVTLQAMKTGALLRFACQAGAIIGRAASDDIARMEAYGEAIGLAFQIADDLLDITGDEKTVGKAVGKDSGAGKGTLVAMHGEAWARSQLKGLVAQAEEVLEPYGEGAFLLREAAHFIANRDR